jgi:hypothetical protein
MIRLKILLKKAPPCEPLEFIVRRDQRDAIEPFARDYTLSVRKLDRDRFLVRMTKGGERR